MSQPLIVTLQLDEASQAFYEDLRRRYYPPGRNLIPAHLTLFHQLPDDDAVLHTLAQVACAHSSFLLASPSLRAIGRGAAVFFQSESIMALHASLSAALIAHLIAQDRQRFRPHIVIQNKVDAETARRTLAELCADRLIDRLVEPHGLGVTLWRYLGGPWEQLSHFPFADVVGADGGW